MENKEYFLKNRLSWKLHKQGKNIIFTIFFTFPKSNDFFQLFL